MTYPLQWIITPRLTQLMKMKRKEAKGEKTEDREKRSKNIWSVKKKSLPLHRF